MSILAKKTLLMYLNIYTIYSQSWIEYEIMITVVDG